MDGVNAGVDVGGAGGGITIGKVVPGRGSRFTMIRQVGSRALRTGILVPNTFPATPGVNPRRSRSRPGRLRYPAGHAGCILERLGWNPRRPGTVLEAWFGTRRVQERT